MAATIHTLVASTPNNRSLFCSDAQKACFENSKEALVDYTQLAFPDPTAFTEFSSGCEWSIYWSCFTRKKNGKHKPLAFWSNKALTKKQSRRSTFDREFYASYTFVCHFCHHLDAKILF